MFKNLLAVILLLGAQAADIMTYKGFTIDHKNNFITGAKYSQKEVGYDKKTQEEILEIAYQYAAEVSAVGFFYQKHSNGYQIVGRYATEADMKGTIAAHSHDDGFIGTADTTAVPAKLSIVVKKITLNSAKTRNDPFMDKM